MSVGAFLSELKRRRVFRVAAAYVVVAFALLQAADIIFPALGLPFWMMTLVVVLAFLGFPVAVVLAWAFDVTAEGVVRTEEAEVAAAGGPHTYRRSLARGALAALVVLAVAAGGWLGWRRLSAGPEVSLDPRVVAVLPFRVAGAEPSLSYLREGMLDLLATKLTGEGGPRAVDPRTLTSAWRRAAGQGTADLSREEALALARGLGAGRLVLGEVVSMPGRVVLTASLSNVATGRVDAPVSVEGPVDSLPALVDRLVAGLLSVGAGEGERLASLTTTSLPALRLYLEGQSAYRRGRYDEAHTRFSRAIEIDSTFSLAGLMTHRMVPWLSGSGSGDSAALALSWRHRERLGARDRAYLTALAGSRYPAHTPGAEWFASWEALVQSRPDSPDAWFEWGDHQLHWGTWMNNPDSTSLRRATDAFNRTLALDSTYLPALGHLFDIATIHGDTAAARRYAELYLARDPHGLIAEGIRGARAAQSRGMDAMPEIVARVDSFGGALRRYTLLYLSFHPSTLPLAFALADHLATRIDDPEVSRALGRVLWTVALNRGRPTEAARYLSAQRRTGQMDSLEFLTHRVRIALHADGDPDDALHAATSLAEQVTQLGEGTSTMSALCVLGQWHLSRGDAATAGALSQRLRTMGNAGETIAHTSARLCAELLDTWRAAATSATDATARIARLDSLVTTSFDGGALTDETNLILARLLEARGDRAGALRVLGRYSAFAGAGSLYRSTFLRERGRVAALLGDTAAAVNSYRFYLAFRSDPEPAIRPEVERIRTELVQLTGRR